MGDFVSPEEVASLAQTNLDRATVELLIKGTEAAVRRHCGWHITQETVTNQVVYPTTGRQMFLPSLFVTAVSSISVNGTPLVENVGYRWRQNGEVLLASYPVSTWSTWGPSWPADTLASYVHGYAAGAAQLDDIKDVVGSAVARRIGNPDVLQQLQVGGIVEQYATSPQLPSIALLQMEKAELSSYTLVTVA